MKTRLSNILLPLIIGFTVTISCKTERDIPTLNSDEIIFYEVFSLLIEESYYDLRLLPPFPPAPKLDENGVLIESDSIEIKRINKSWEARKQKILADTTKIVILVQDSLKIRILSAPDSLNTINKLDVTKIKSTNPKIEFKYYSKFPNGRKIWRKKYDFYLDGIFLVGSLYLNSDKSKGHINVSYTKGILNGSGATVHFKKLDDGKWEITQVINTWIS